MSNDNSNGPIAAINVTPLVDVMLVLLVIFMVTAPMLQQGVDVNLPKVSASGMAGKDEQVVISVDKAGNIFVGDKNKLEVDEIAPKIKAILEAKPGAGNKVYIKADTDLNYGRVMQVMGALTKGGINQIGLVSMPDDNKQTK